jgi:hypothetical protein
MSGDGDSERLSPDDAFATLGNETRLGILQTLGRAGEDLSFSVLRDRVGVEDSGQFNYHLEQLVGHFVRKTEDGYQLRRAGRRVVEAVLSGAVTDAPTWTGRGSRRPVSSVAPLSRWPATGGVLRCTARSVLAATATPTVRTRPVARPTGVSRPAYPAPGRAP